MPFFTSRSTTNTPDLAPVAMPTPCEAVGTSSGRSAGMCFHVSAGCLPARLHAASPQPQRRAPSSSTIGWRLNVSIVGREEAMPTSRDLGKRRCPVRLAGRTGRKRLGGRSTSVARKSVVIAPARAAPPPDPGAGLRRGRVEPYKPGRPAAPAAAKGTGNDAATYTTNVRHDRVERHVRGVGACTSVARAHGVVTGVAKPSSIARKVAPWTVRPAAQRAMVPRETPK